MRSDGRGCTGVIRDTAEAGAVREAERSRYVESTPRLLRSRSRDPRADPRDLGVVSDVDRDERARACRESWVFGVL